MPTADFAATFGRLAANHLWQSTAFAGVAALLALALRGNHARVRHGLWMAASVKFLVPFAVLAAVGGALGHWVVPAPAVARVPAVVAQMVQPFAAAPDMATPGALPATVERPSPMLPVSLVAIWFCGFAAVCAYGWRRWGRVAAAVRDAEPLTDDRVVQAWGRVRKADGPRNALGCLWVRLPSSLRLVSSTAALEPGVFGFFRPVLWLPVGIAERLEDAELEAILAHELCHVRRRDNLLATIHMAVEAIFWFHPLVWWLGARLTEERERACDEEVVRMGGEPQIYAESILKVCEFYLSSPTPCTAGVTGGELKKRIEGITAGLFARDLTRGKKLLLSAAATAAIAGPLALGVFHAPAVAQSQPEFEAASVKPAAPPRPGVRRVGMRGGPGSPDPGRIDFLNVSLKTMVTAAYDMKFYSVFGPDWIDSQRFDVAATLPPETTKEQYHRMLQKLLVDRFQLVVHKETREMALLRLVVAKGGSKLKPPVPDPPSQDTAPPKGSPKGGALDRDGYPALAPQWSMAMVTVGNNPMARAQGHKKGIDALVELLEGQTDGPVVDATGLKGEYDYTLSWVATHPGTGPSDAASDVGPDLFAALPEQLGLRLEPAKGPVEVLVIDRANRTPAEN